MRADRVSRGGDELEDLRLVGGVQSDREEDGLGAVRRECCEHRLGILWPRPVVEGEHHLAFPQEIMGLEVFEAKTGPVPIASTSPAQAASGEGPVRTVVTTVEEQGVAPVAAP